MTKCLAKLARIDQHGEACHGDEIRGKVYFFPRMGAVEDVEHCTPCAKVVMGPLIAASLNDVVQILATFGDVYNLSYLGGAEVVEEVVGDRKAPRVTRTWGRLGAVASGFQEGRNLFQVRSRASTLTAEARFLVCGHVLEAISRLYPKANLKGRDRVRRRLRHAKERYEEATRLKEVVDHHLGRMVMVPSGTRSDFFKATNDSFFDVLQVIKILAPSFKREDRARAVEEQDGKLIEKIVGFDPTSLVSKAEDEGRFQDAVEATTAVADGDAREARQPEDKPLGNASDGGVQGSLPAAERTRDEDGGGGQPPPRRRRRANGVGHGAPTVLRDAGTLDLDALGRHRARLGRGAGSELPPVKDHIAQSIAKAAEAVGEDSGAAAPTSTRTGGKNTKGRRVSATLGNGMRVTGSPTDVAGLLASVSSESEEKPGGQPKPTRGRRRKKP